MHVHLTDAYQHGTSRLHHMDARLKLITALGLILLIGFTPMAEFGVYAGFFALAMIGAWIGRLNPLLVIRRSLVVLPFTLAAITLLFTVKGNTILTVPSTGWTISDAGLIRFSSIMIKSIVSVQFAVLLILTTHLTDMLWALGALRAPKVLVAIISFMYRYLFLLADESLRLTRARDSRSAVIGGNPMFGRNIIFRARTTGGMIGNLLLRSFERSERIYQAMLARGYQGQMRQLSPPPIPQVEVVLAGVVLGIGAMLLVISLL
jgi:cobalt/nickel transport system permease protein